MGVPTEDIGNITDAGGVNVLYGTATGLSATGDQFWSQDSTNVDGSAEISDLFGWSLAAADYGNTTHLDLAIGAKWEDIGSVVDAGSVNVLYGTSTGLSATNDQLWSQDVANIEDSAETEEFFGSAVFGANFGGNVQADLVVGVPDEDLPINTNGAGAVNVIYGTSTGLSATGDQFWNQGSPGVLNNAETGDTFGWSLA